MLIGGALVRIATWNVNSIRVRLPRVLSFLHQEHIDVLAMQEIKCCADQFPEQEFHSAGYQIFANGLNQWNGVALAVRQGMEARILGTQFSGEVPQPIFNQELGLEPRVLGVNVTGVDLWCLYVPNGRELNSAHFTYKLEWLDSLRSHALGILAKNAQAMALFMGDFNVAPRDEDVWDMREFAGKTHVSIPERAAFARLLSQSAAAESVSLDAQLLADMGTDGKKFAGLVEVTRRFAPGWTYWDYQKLRWRRNQGMKIDFALATPAFANKVVGARICQQEREGEKPSDHVPVLLNC